jgi:hypothetical protein
VSQANDIIDITPRVDVGEWHVDDCVEHFDRFAILDWLPCGGGMVGEVDEHIKGFLNDNIKKDSV